MGFKIRCHDILLHTENSHFMGTGICGFDPPGKPRKLVQVPHEI